MTWRASSFGRLSSCTGIDCETASFFVGEPSSMRGVTQGMEDALKWLPAFTPMVQKRSSWFFAEKSIFVKLAKSSGNWLLFAGCVHLRRMPKSSSSCFGCHAAGASILSFLFFPRWFAMQFFHQNSWSCGQQKSPCMCGKNLGVRGILRLARISGEFD